MHDEEYDEEQTLEFIRRDDIGQSSDAVKGSGTAEDN